MKIFLLSCVVFILGIHLENTLLADGPRNLSEVLLKQIVEQQIKNDPQIKTLLQKGEKGTESFGHGISRRGGTGWSYGWHINKELAQKTSAELSSDPENGSTRIWITKSETAIGLSLFISYDQGDWDLFGSNYLTLRDKPPLRMGYDLNAHTNAQPWLKKKLDAIVSLENPLIQKFLLNSAEISNEQ